VLIYVYLGKSMCNYKGLSVGKSMCNYKELSVGIVDGDFYKREKHDATQQHGWM